MERVGAVIALARFFKKDGQSSQSFAAEIRQLSAEERRELAELAAVELGVELREEEERK